MGIKDKLIQGMYITASIVNDLYSKDYHGPLENTVHWYANDVTIPFGIYFAHKFLNIPFTSENKWLNAACALNTCGFLEAAQQTGAIGGTYDPMDFLAYATGIGLALVVDKLTFKEKDLDNLVKESI